MDSLLDAGVCLVYGVDLMEFVLVLAEDAACAEQLVFSLAEDGDGAVVLEASNGVVRTDQHGVGVQGMTELLSVFLQFLLDIQLEQAGL